MKKVFIAILILFAFSMLSGCAAIDKLQEQSSEKVSELIIKYCGATEERFREKFRKQINDRMIGIAEIRVTCIE